jgi:DNA-nicking Smr family endonuclease
MAEPPAQEDLFAQEMQRMGVKAVSPPEGSSTPSDAEEQTVPVDDLTLFLEALGEGHTIHAKPDAEGAQEAAPPASLGREARRGRVVPDDVLDLHGYTRTEALNKVAWFVDNALYSGSRYLLIITGRGRQSGEAVLREALEGWLRSAGSRGVREWCRAPARLGGEGALLLALKKKG